MVLKDRAYSSGRGYGARWQRERRKFLESNPFCVRCYEEGHITICSPEKLDIVIIQLYNKLYKRIKEEFIDGNNAKKTGGGGAGNHAGDLEK